MGIETVGYSISKFFKRNGGTILTVLSIVGLSGTAYLSGKAAIKAKEKLDKNPEATTKEKIKMLTPVYIWPAAAGAATAACMLGANGLNRKQQASMLAASAILEETYRKYKSKAEEILGTNEVEKKMAEDDISEAPKELDKDERLFYYNYYENAQHPEYGSYFTSTVDKVLKAEMELNRTFILRGKATLNDFFKLLDLDDREGGDELGWSVELGSEFYGYSWVDFEHYDTKLEDGMECTIINTPFQPSILA